MLCKVTCIVYRLCYCTPVSIESIVTNKDSIPVSIESIVTNKDSIPVSIESIVTNKDSIPVSIESIVTNKDSIALYPTLTLILPLIQILLPLM